MTRYLRMMKKEDIPQVSEIDREAFPTQLPAPNFQRELRSRLSHYIVAADGERPVEQAGPHLPPKNGLGRLISGLGRMLGRSPGSDGQSGQASGQNIDGFVVVFNI